MISVYNISNLKIVYNSDTDSFIAFEDENSFDSETPIFSAESLTSQEKYLLNKIVSLYNNYEYHDTQDVVKDLKRKNTDLFEVIEELNKRLLECKNECAAFKAEISELRQSKLEFERIEKEDEYS